MTRALRSVSSEKGRDPREFALVAYGGAGPVHAAGLADALGCRTVVVPPLAGLFSAMGLLFARPEFHDVHACHIDARSVLPEEIEAAFAALEARVAQATDVPVEWARSAELRYGGQTWEVEVEAPAGHVDADALSALVTRFEEEHERLYGVRGEDGAPIEIRALRVAALGPSSAVDRLGLHAAPPERDAARPAAFDGTVVDVPVRTRASMGTTPERGPVLVDEYDTTVVVPPGWNVRRDGATECLVLERG